MRDDGAHDGDFAKRGYPAWGCYGGTELFHAGSSPGFGPGVNLRDDWKGAAETYFDCGLRSDGGRQGVLGDVDPVRNTERSAGAMGIGRTWGSPVLVAIACGTSEGGF